MYRLYFLSGLPDHVSVYGETGILKRVEMQLLPRHRDRAVSRDRARPDSRVKEEQGVAVRVEACFP